MFGFYKEIIDKMKNIGQQNVIKTDRKELPGVITSPGREVPEHAAINKSDEKIIFSKNIKILIWVIGIMYIIVATVGISVAIKSGIPSKAVKYFIMIPLDIVSLILVLSKNKKKQFIAIGTIFLFIMFNFGTAVK